MFQSSMETRKRSRVAPITVFKNGNKYDKTQCIYNPRYVQTFDALLDQLTAETRATCAIRRIYTPHGRRQVGNLSAIEPGGVYVAVSRGRFKKLQYGRTVVHESSLGNSTTTKSRREAAGKAIHSRLQESYNEQIKTQKTIYVHRNGVNETPVHIFLTSRMLRSMEQVLDLVQEKIDCTRAIVSLRKLNGLTINEVARLQPEGRYVAVEQGQRFKRISYDQVDQNSELASARRLKLPLITANLGHSTWRSNTERNGHSRLPSNESNPAQHTSRGKPRLKLPVIHHNVHEPRGFQVVYGYPKRETGDTARQQDQEQHHGGMGPSHKGVFYATGAQRQHGAQIYDNKYIRVDKPLDMTAAQEVEEELDGDYGNTRRDQHAPRRPQERKPEKQTRPRIPEPPQASKPLTRPSIAHPRKHRYEKSLRVQEKSRSNVSPGKVTDQRFSSHDNDMARNTKQYVATREQRLMVMHGTRDGREPVNNVVHVYAADTRSRELERQNVAARQKRIEEWVTHTVNEKEKEDEIATVAKHLVFNAIVKAGGTPDRNERPEETTRGPRPPPRKTNAPSFYDEKKSNGIKYHRVFGT